MDFSGQLSKGYEDILSKVQANRQAQQAQLAQGIADQNAALDEQYVVTMQQIANREKELGDAMQFPEAQFDAKRNRALADYQYNRQKMLLNLYGQDQHFIDRQMHAYDKDSEAKYGEFLKPWEQSQQYKNVAENWKAIDNQSDRVLGLKNNLKQGAEYINKKDMQAATEFFKTGTMKMLNNLYGNDAVQIGEMLVKYKNLLNPVEINELAGRSPLSQIPFIAKFLTGKGGENDTQKLQKALGNLDEVETKNIFKKFEQQLAADPVRFYNIATDTLNAAAKSFNDQVDARVIAPSSRRTAANLGVFYIDPLNKIEIGQQAPAFPQQLSPAIQGGAGQISTPQQPAQPTPFSGQTKSGVKWTAVPR